MDVFYCENEDCAETIDSKQQQYCPRCYPFFYPNERCHCCFGPFGLNAIECDGCGKRQCKRCIDSKHFCARCHPLFNPKERCASCRRLIFFIATKCIGCLKRQCLKCIDGQKRCRVCSQRISMNDALLTMATKHVPQLEIKHEDTDPLSLYPTIFFKEVSLELTLKALAQSAFDAYTKRNVALYQKLMMEFDQEVKQYCINQHQDEMVQSIRDDLLRKQREFRTLLEIEIKMQMQSIPFVDSLIGNVLTYAYFPDDECFVGMPMTHHESTAFFEQL